MINKEKESTTIRICIDKDLKEKSEQLFNELGLNLSTAIIIFIKQSVRENGIPFDISLNTPNPETSKELSKDLDL